ncbi:MAG: hypothetical protein JSS02_23735 [Planctomycetes bacterium]|nr:hypothetical protein [Planctomycetota bacterium]
MSKNGLILASLVGAIPGALITYLMVMAFINFAGGPTVLHKILCVLSMLIGLLLTALPIGIFVLGGPKSEKNAKKDADDEDSGKKAGKSSRKKEDEDDEVEEIEEVDSADAVETLDAVTDENIEVEEGSLDEFAVTGEVLIDDDDVEDAAPKKPKKR